MADLNNFGRVSKDLILDIVAGRVTGARLIRKRGVGTVAANTTRDAWSNSSSGNQPIPTAAAALEAVSSSTNDTAAGTGARTISVEGLDANYAVVTQTVTLNGTSAVALATNLMRINKITVLTAGSAQSNAGTISIRTVSGSTVWAQVTSPHGLENDLRYTVPAGKVAFVLSLHFTTNSFLAALATYAQATMIFFTGEQTGATPADLVYYAHYRLASSANRQNSESFGWGFKMTEKTVLAPAVQNTDATNAINWQADLLIVELDA